MHGTIWKNNCRFSYQKRKGLKSKNKMLYNINDGVSRKNILKT